MRSILSYSLHVRCLLFKSLLVGSYILSLLCGKFSVPFLPFFMAKLLFNFSQKTTTTLYPSVIVFHHFCWNKSHKVPPPSSGLAKRDFPSAGRSLFLPPPIISSMTGWVSISSLVIRPLPKPPPSHKLTSDLIPRRPPRKPP